MSGTSSEKRASIIPAKKKERILSGIPEHVLESSNSKSISISGGEGSKSLSQKDLASNKPLSYQRIDSSIEEEKVQGIVDSRRWNVPKSTK